MRSLKYLEHTRCSKSVSVIKNTDMGAPRLGAKNAMRKQNMEGCMPATGVKNDIVAHVKMNSTK